MHKGDMSELKWRLWSSKPCSYNDII